MAMPFWPKTDYERFVELFEYVDANLTKASPWTGYDRIYDPASFFEPPALSTDPEAPTLYGVWGIESVEFHGEIFDPDVAGARNVELLLSIFQQKPKRGGSAIAPTLEAFSAVWAQMQAASVSGLTLGTQSMRWTHPPMREDPDFFESQLAVEVTST